MTIRRKDFVLEKRIPDVVFSSLFVDIVRLCLLLLKNLWLAFPVAVLWLILLENTFKKWISNQKTISPWKRRLQRWRSESVGQRGPCYRGTRDAHRAEAWSWIILLVLADDICIEVSPRKRRAICLIVLVMLLVSVSKYKNSDLKALFKKLADVAFKWYTPLGFWRWTNIQFDGVPIANWKGNNSQ